MSGKARSWKQMILAVILAALTLTAGQVYGQSQAITATLSGTVLDPTGQTVSGSKITLVSPERGISRTYVTTDTGFYSFTLLPPATYRLQVEAPGFKHYRQDGIELIPGQTAVQNVGLLVGAVSENIEVTSQAPLLNAENANISSDVSARQVVDLPLNLRSVIGLASLSSFGESRCGRPDCGLAGQCRNRRSGCFVPEFRRHVLQHRCLLAGRHL